MKKTLLFALMLLTWSTSVSLVAQNAKPPCAQSNQIIEGKSLNIGGQLNPMKLERATRDLANGVQEPKWLTNLPCDSSIYEFMMYGPKQESTYHYSTLIKADLVERFIGNTVKTIKTFVPAGGFGLHAWIMDATSAETLWSADIENYAEGALVDIPCDYTIKEARNLQVGITITFPACDKIYLGVVPCFRELSWLISSTNPSWKQDYVYDYSTYFHYLGKSTYFGLPFYCITEGDGGLKVNGLELSEVSHTRVLMGENADFTTNFVNYGCQSIQNATFEFQLGDRITQYQHNAPIPYLGSGSFNNEISTENAAERLPLKVRLKAINGEEVTTENEVSSSGSIITIDPKKNVKRTVVMEEFTGTWCGWCPRGMVAIDVLSEEYGDKFIPIAVHSGDNMVDNSFNGVLSNFSDGSFPSCVLNRVVRCDPYHGTYGGDMGVDNDVNDIFFLPTEGVLSIDNLSISDDNTKLTVTTSATFSINCANTPYGISYVLTEDGVVDSQLNYFSIYASDYSSNPYLKELTKLGKVYEATFNHVGRALYGTFGVEGSLSGTIVPDETKTHTYEITIPENITDINKVHLVAMLVDAESGEIVNATTMKVSEVTGIKQVAGDVASASIEVGAGSLNIRANNAVATVYTPDGRTVVSRRVNGNIGLHLPSGSYIVRVEDGQNATVKKVQF